MTTDPSKLDLLTAVCAYCGKSRSLDEMRVTVFFSHPVCEPCMREWHEEPNQFITKMAVRGIKPRD